MQIDSVPGEREREEGGKGMHLYTSKFNAKPEGVTEMPGSVTTPAGFYASGIAAGIKKSGKRDLGLLVCKKPAASAVMLTRNAAQAAPVKVCRSDVALKAVQGVVVNSGSANACTGEIGVADAREMVKLAAVSSRIEPSRMAVASTGIIGQRLPMDAVVSGIAEAISELSENGGKDFADAIMTTDRLEKQGAIEVELAAGKIHIGACAKGAGMIAPNMATMLAFITTDATASADILAAALAGAAAASFNAASVDGDMSTNDCAFLIASGDSGVSLDPGSGDLEKFTAALTSVCKSLALKMVADGEGATKVIELTVAGAGDDEEAARVARAISLSPLVRTAFYGSDANWGRLIASAGAALAGEDDLDADIFYEEICLTRGGVTADEAVDEERLAAIMAAAEIAVKIDLRRGGSECKIYFSDLTHEYVTINAEYTT
ncbi:MAG: bifunctional glutamate N-acetyltransferase/amino-acid acetyltransferase ArgJ [Thermoleophilia bacterium]